jgi:hypothetical protein
LLFAPWIMRTGRMLAVRGPLEGADAWMPHAAGDEDLIPLGVVGPPNGLLIIVPGVLSGEPRMMRVGAVSPDAPSLYREREVVCRSWRPTFPPFTPCRGTTSLGFLIIVFGPASTRIGATSPWSAGLNTDTVPATSSATYSSPGQRRTRRRSADSSASSAPGSCAVAACCRRCPPSRP